MEPHFYLIYTSKSTGLMSESRLANLLEQSRKNNEACGMTGMLLYMESRFLDRLEGRFLQLLEGREEDVHRVYSLILTDVRNRSVLFLDSGYLEHQIFPTWSMGYSQVPDEPGVKATGFFKLDDSFLAGGLPKQPEGLLSYFRSFYEINKADGVANR